MNNIRVLELCAGIGGFSLAATWLGCEIAGQVEIDPWCRRVLQKHWPDVPKMADVFDVKGDEFGSVDLIVGGFPCQPYSLAGKRQGAADDRAIWPQVMRVVRTARPRLCLFENVPGLISIESMGLDTVLADLEADGYACGAVVIPACAVNALHRRDRVWIMAHASGERTGDHSRANSGQTRERADAYQSAHLRQAHGASGSGWLGASGTDDSAGGMADAEGSMELIPSNEAMPISGGRQSRLEYQRGGTGFAGPGTDPSLADATARGLRRRSAPGEPGQPAQRGQGATVDSRGRSGLPNARQVARSLDAGLDGLPAGLVRRPAAGPALPDLIRQAWADGSWEIDLPRVVADEPERRQKLQAAGNAIVPLVAYEILRVMIGADDAD